MKFLIAIDSFKGSMSSLEAGASVAEGIKRIIPDCECKIMPIADGGEGTVEALTLGLGGEMKEVCVNNPLSRPVIAKYGRVGNTAIMEMAAAAGIALIDKSELNPMITTTYGVGEMIKDAVMSGCRDFIIGIGGSATNDGGVGMLEALGFEFLDENGNKVARGARGLSSIAEIRDDKMLPELRKCNFNIACDVKNPLCGEFGCSEIFSPQKGASKENVKVMDIAMRHYAEKTVEKYKNSDPEFEGAGAAGGLGFAFMSYLGGVLRSGIELILDSIGIEEHMKNADLVITGEGRIDSQTVMGKAPIGIARLAKKYNKDVIAFSGCVTRDANICNKHGIDAIFPITRGASTLEEAMNVDNAKKNIADCAEQVISLWLLGHK